MTRPKKTSVAEPSSSQRPLRNRTVTDMFTKQKTAANRKRIVENDESSDEDELESDSDSEDELPTKNKKTTNRRGKGKKVATNVVLSSNSQLLEQISDTLVTQDSLFDRAMLPETSIDDIVTEWAQDYQTNQRNALKSLINFVIRSAGCSMAVTDDALDQEDGSLNALQELQEELAKLPHADYPIISKSKEHRTLKRNLLLFFEELIEQCQHNAIYDGVLIETLQNWLTTMSSSVYRPFRHTATLVGLKIIGQLCVIGEKERNNLSVASRQMNAEKKKKSQTKNLNLLQQNYVAIQSRCKDLEEYLKEFFEGIFIHRSRDVESVIRTECIRELCIWMQNFQSFFVDNAYLRYFGWSLNDPSAGVRSETLKSISKLYKIENVATKLSVFINRFKSRIEEMALFDIDVSVRVYAIQLCSQLFKQNINILSETGRSHLSSMVASDAARVRKSAAPFVKAMLDTNVISPLLQSTTRALSSGRRNNVTINKSWVTYKGLALFLVEQTAALLESQKAKNDNAMHLDLENLTSQLSEKRRSIIANIVDALWEQLPELQDYQAMSDYLGRDHSKSLQEIDQMDTGSTIEDCYRLDDEQETVLIHVFVACLNTAISKGLDKNVPEGTKDKRKLEASFFEECKNEVSRHLVQTLPKLLTKHFDDAHRMQQLVTIPTLMNLQVYIELRAEKEYDELLEILNRIYLGAILNDLLKNCAESLSHVVNNTQLMEVNRSFMGELQTAVVQQVREACSGKDLVTVNYTSALIHSISVGLLRLERLMNFVDATSALDDAQGMSMSVIDHIGALVDRAAFGSKEEKNISLSAMAILARYMMWKCHALSAANATEVAPVIERRRDWTFDKFTELIKAADVSPLDEVRATALSYLIDIYWLFTSDLFDNAGLARLKARCPADLQKACGDYIEAQLKKYRQLLEDFDIDDEPSKQALEAHKELLSMSLSSFARGVLMGVLDMKYAVSLLSQYGNNEPVLDDVIKALVVEFQTDLISGEVAADGICRAYMEALKTSFDTHVAESSRSLEKTVRLAKLEAASLRNADKEDVARKVPAQVICERIHLDGITFAITKAADAYQRNKDEDRDNALKFFKVLNAFASDISRARDIAKIHYHLEDVLRSNGLPLESDKKEWEHYNAYVQSIDQVLKKKGLKYDATKRTANMETPAAHVFDDIDLDAQAGNKRTLTDVDMDIDDESNPKRRR
ncbi:Cohesin subunit SA-1 [Choanephora cucurbitarum]|uniref:Cohesin subunit SA-1 n=1 Tax=Choanephora cucurbitarum TaxID=101091 RepID=A0A1C7NAK8_9FUNG|nr:Cohesin subunit SA-1 [Choanephora cucurbitarum]